MIKAVLFIMIPFISMSQNIPETVKYINDICKTHTFNSPTPAGVDVRSHYQISVNKIGKLTVLSLLDNAKTHVILDQPITNTSYLKSLSMGDSKDLPEEGFAFSINCIGGRSCVIQPETAILSGSKTNFLKFALDDADAREKCKNAFSHLLELAKNKKEFHN